MPLGVGLGQPPRRLEGRSLADTGEDVGERAPLIGVHHDVVGRQQRRADFARERGAAREGAAHVLAISQARPDPKAVAERLAESREKRALTATPLP